MSSQLGDFLAQVQSGQELSQESLWPAEITLPGVTDPIPCSGGSVRETGVQLLAGGLMGEYTLAFRVRKALLPAAPEVNTLLGYRGRQWLIMRVTDSPHDGCYYLGADNSNK